MVEYKVNDFVTNTSKNDDISKPDASTSFSHFSSVGEGVEDDWLASRGSSVLHLLTFPNVMRAFNTWNRGISERMVLKNV